MYAMISPEGRTKAIAATFCTLLAVAAQPVSRLPAIDDLQHPAGSRVGRRQCLAASARLGGRADRLDASDIFGMQEVQPNQKSDLAADLPQYRLFGGGRDDGKEKGEASPIGFDTRRFDFIEGGMFWLSPTPTVPSRGLGCRVTTASRPGRDYGFLARAR